MKKLTSFVDSHSLDDIENFNELISSDFTPRSDEQKEQLEKEEEEESSLSDREINELINKFTTNLKHHNNKVIPSHSIIDKIIDFMNKSDKSLSALPKYTKIFSILYYSTKMFSHFRPQAYDKGTNKNTHINQSFELYQGAGTGKDSLIVACEKVFRGFNIKLTTRQKQQIDEYNKAVKLRAIKEFPSKKPSQTIQKQRDAYIQEHSMNLINNTITKSTTEGLQNALSKTLKLGFGSVSVETGELNNLIKTSSETSGDSLLSEVLEVYDANKIFTKGLVKFDRIYGGTPVNMWGHTSPEDISNTAKKQIMYQEHFARGTNRRTLICIVPDKDIKQNNDALNVSNFNKISSSEIKVPVLLQSSITNIFSTLDTHFSYWNYNLTNTITGKPQMKLMDYTLEANILSYVFFNHTHKKQGELNKSIIVKSKKIAMVSALLNNRLTINEMDLQYGIDICLWLLEDSNKKLDDTFKSNKSELYTYLQKNKNKQFKRKELLDVMNYTGTSTLRAKQLNDELIFIKTFCGDDGFTLIFSERSRKPITLKQKQNQFDFEEMDNDTY